MAGYRTETIDIENNCHKVITFFDSGALNTIVYYKNETSEQRCVEHRTNGLPSYVSYTESGEIHYVNYYVNGLVHRDGDLPAVYFYDKGEVNNIQYYEHGFPINKEEIERRIRLKKRKELLKNIKHGS